MSFLESAIKLAEKGFHVFPIHADSKLPVIKDFAGKATKDITQIKKWWTDPVMGVEKPYNIGICTTHFNCNQALVVVDVDDKGDKKGSDEVLRLELEGKMFTKTLTQTTPSSGQHLIYKIKKAVNQGTDVLAKGIDIRSNGGYIVAPGSTIGGVEYKLDETFLDIKDCPKWIADACRKSEQEKLVVDIEKINIDRATKRAINYLENEAPTAVEGESGDQTTYVVACKLKDLGVEPYTATDLMNEHWNDRCSPPWTPEELALKIYNAYKYGKNTIGQDAPEASFEPIKQDSDSGSYLDKINREFALIWTEGNHTVLWEKKSSRGLPTRSFINETSFRRMFSTELVQIDGNKMKSKAELWLNWSGRREYNGLCFLPEKKAKFGYYNLWKGFSVKPKSYASSNEKAKKGFDDFIHHIRKNICDNHEDQFNWIITYFAHLIQKPYEKPRSSLVFKGKKGVGKNVVVERIGKLIKDNHAVAHDSRYLTSNFNGHLEDCLMLVLDEAFWSGDKSAEGKLKGLITAPEIFIEKKGKDSYVVDNFLRLVIIGNENWLVPASQDERRYMVFNVESHNINDVNFFNTMVENMDLHGGNEILMDYLKKWDLKTIDHNVPLTTKGLGEQKILTLDLDKEYLYEKLYDGEIAGMPWPERIEKSVLHDDYLIFCKKKNAKGRTIGKIPFGMRIKEVIPSIKHGKSKTEANSNCHILPDLKTSRECFSRWLGAKIDWPEIED